MKYFFSVGFRPFFLLTAAIAVLVPMYFVAVSINDYYFPGKLLGVIPWHGHELLFGLVPALLTGFLLTASPNWTQTKPINGFRLIILTFIWLFTRYVMWWQPNSFVLYLFGPLSTAILLFIMLKVLKGNRNRFIVTGLLSFLVVANVLYLFSYLEEDGKFLNLGLILTQASVFFFLFIFSGRLIPFFSNNKLSPDLSKITTKVDIGIGACAIGFFSSSILFEIQWLNNVFAFFAFTLFLVRAYFFYHKKILKDLMVYSLHISHLWLVLYFPLFALEQMYPDTFLARPSLHCLFVGALAHFAMAIMSRASLGHSGRKIQSDILIAFAFFAIFIGALGRIFLPVLRGVIYDVYLHISMGFWTLGFVFFLIKFAPIYFKPRFDGKA